MNEKEVIAKLWNLYNLCDATDQYGDRMDMEPFEEAIKYAEKAVQMQEVLKAQVTKLKSFAKDPAQTRIIEEDIALLENYIVDNIPRDLTEVDIQCCNEIMTFTDDGYINFVYECWFDVNRFFKTDTENNDDEWVNFYTNWYPNGDIKAPYTINTSYATREFEYPLSDKEKAFFLAKMEEYCQKREGMSLSELWKECEREREE